MSYSNLLTVVQGRYKILAFVTRCLPVLPEMFYSIWRSVYCMADTSIQMGKKICQSSCDNHAISFESRSS